MAVRWVPLYDSAGYPCQLRKDGARVERLLNHRAAIDTGSRLGGSEEIARNKDHSALVVGMLSDEFLPEAAAIEAGHAQVAEDRVIFGLRDPRQCFEPMLCM